MADLRRVRPGSRLQRIHGVAACHVLVFTVFTLATGLGCGSMAGDEFRVADTSPPVATPDPGSSAAEPAVNLEELLIDPEPSGFVPVATGTGIVGGFGLEDYLTIASLKPSEDRALLSGNRFQRGFARAWYRPEGRGQILIFTLVFEFETAAGAMAVYEAHFDGAPPGSNVETFPVPVGTARGLTYTQLYEGDVTMHFSEVTLVRERWVFSFSVGHPEAPIGQEDLVVLAQLQAERVAKLS